MRRNPAATQNDDIAVIIQWNYDIVLYVIDTSQDKVLGSISMTTYLPLKHRWLPMVSLSTAIREDGISYGPLTYMFAIQFASNPSFFQKYIRNYQVGYALELEDLNDNVRGAGSTLLELGSPIVGLMPDIYPTKNAARLWTRILKDSNIYTPNSVLIAIPIPERVNNEFHPDMRSSLNHAYRLQGDVSINGVDVDLEKALRKGNEYLRGVISEKSDSTLSQGLATSTLSLQDYDTDYDYPTSFTIP